LQKVYADIAYTWFSKARKQLSWWQPCVGSESFIGAEVVGIKVVGVVFGSYVATKQGHAEEMAEIMLVGPQLFK